MSEIWILGATGRVGREVARSLEERGQDVVLVGRDADRLKKVGKGRRVIASGADGLVRAVAEAKAGDVVVNTVGPFTETALPILGATMAHYVDIANDIFAVRALLDQDAAAKSGNRSLVTGAGWGFVGTEALVRALCKDRPPATHVRVTAVARVTGEDVIGEALAATLVDALVRGGRRYDDGKLVRAPVGADTEELTLPDGVKVTAGLAPTGDLEAAHRAARAPNAIAASTEVPAGKIAGTLVGAAATVLGSKTLQNAAIRRLAKVKFNAKPKSAHSWGHATVEWRSTPAGPTNGGGPKIRTGFLRAGDGMDFTTKVLAETALRLARGEGKPGACTPCELFGETLATDAGAELILQ